MGVLNVTPDSFYDGGRYEDTSNILPQVEKMLEEGAAIIDIGGYSSRPGAPEVPEKIELKRVTKGVKVILENFPGIFLSVDTFRSKVAYAAVQEGAGMVNDISGGELDSEMFNTVAKLKVPYVLMHMKGTPQNMSHETSYGNLLKEILEYFLHRINKLKEYGVNDIVVDPGFGFAKTISQNYEILRNLDYFKVLETPMIIGLSRKALIYKSLGITSSEALNGTTVLNTIGLINGASILRAHDVREAMEVIKLYKLTYH